MGGAYPELSSRPTSIDMWLAAEEQSFGRTLDQGTQTLEEEVERVRAAGAAALAPRRSSACTTPTGCRMR